MTTIESSDFKSVLDAAFVRDGDPATLVFDNYLRWKGTPEYLIRPAAPEDGQPSSVSDNFAVLCYPANELFTTFCTLGASRQIVPGSPASFGDPRGVRYEYIMHAPQPHEHAIAELLVLIAEHPYNHAIEVGPGFILPIGEPVVPGSGMEYLYYTYPYLDDPQIYEQPYGQIERPQLMIQTLWVFPIYRSEVQFIRRNGPDAWETRLQEHHSEIYDAYKFLRNPLVN